LNLSEETATLKDPHSSSSTRINTIRNFRASEPATFNRNLQRDRRGLRQRRESLSLNLEDVERNTHVKVHYLDALEKGAMDRLPSTVQTRGMLSNYATFLDLDVDVLLLRFADGLQAWHREKNPQKPARKPGQPILASMPVIRTFIAGDMVFGVGMAVLLVGFAIWGINRVVTIQSQEEVQPTAPSISDVPAGHAGPVPVHSDRHTAAGRIVCRGGTPTIIIPTININVSVQVNLIAVERTYMRVVVDGEVAFEGRVIKHLSPCFPWMRENTVDSDSMAQLLMRDGYRGTDDPHKANVLIVNTCGFIGPAKDESFEVLRELAEIKRKGQIPDRRGLPDPALRRGSGTKSPRHRRRARHAPLDGHRPGGARIRRGPHPEPLYHLPGDATVGTDEQNTMRASVAGSSAYLKVADGCRRPCAFCAIPLIKGTAVSRPVETILDEARRLRDAGVREFILIAQDTTDYGHDLGMKDGLAVLLEQLTDAVPDMDWIRIMYAYPGYVTDRLIDVMAEQSRSCLTSICRSSTPIPKRSTDEATL
jgi:cytoskeletal protein RodZ